MPLRQLALAALILLAAFAADFVVGEEDENSVRTVPDTPDDADAVRPTADEEDQHCSHDHDEEDSGGHHHHHDDHGGLSEPPPRDDEADFGPPDWIAEVTDQATGRVSEVRAVLRTRGLHYYSPTNFRSALAHALGAGSTDGDGSAPVAGAHVLVLLYRPGSDLCVQARDKWLALAETVQRALHDGGSNASVAAQPAVAVGVFRVDAFASQDEVDAGGDGSGGDGAEVLREHGAEDLLHDVPAVVVFGRDAAAKTGISMRRWSGVLDVREVLVRYGGGQVRERLGELLAERDVERTRVGSFVDGVVDV